MIIDGIYFDVISVNIQNNDHSIYRDSHLNQSVSGFRENKIEINTKTLYSNILNNWIYENRFNKKNVIFNGINIYGIYPIEYTMTDKYIEIRFSADYINGDFTLFNKNTLRKEKLKKLNLICQMS